MEIRDLLYGSIQFKSIELPVLDSKYFQRLRNIKQMGFADLAFPSASHHRYSHSIGAMRTASLIWEKICQNSELLKETALPDQKAFRQIIRLAGLLHDVGHGPLSHTTEIAMPPFDDLKLPYFPKDPRKATHEDYTLKILLDSKLTSKIDQLGNSFGFDSTHVAMLIQPKLAELLPEKANFFLKSVAGEKMNFLPILHQIISSEIDADRMDYLRRDNLLTGVSYGQFDYDWMTSHMTASAHENRIHLTLQHRALYAFEDFLLSRFHMFLMVYYHHKAVIYDEMLLRYFKTSTDSFTLPADIETYLKWDDARLWSELADSNNEWAKRIVDHQPLKKFIELNSGMTSKINEDPTQELGGIIRKLEEKKIPHLLSKSISEISKYFGRPSLPIYVEYENGIHPVQYIPLSQCSELFQKYPEKRTLTRIYVAPDQISEARSILKN